jgi:hypothetical protein
MLKMFQRKCSMHLKPYKGTGDRPVGKTLFLRIRMNYSELHLIKSCWNFCTCSDDSDSARTRSQWAGSLVQKYDSKKLSLLRSTKALDGRERISFYSFLTSALFVGEKSASHSENESTPANIGSWGSSVSIVYDYRLDNRGSIPSRGKGFFL